MLGHQDVFEGVKTSFYASNAIQPFPDKTFGFLNSHVLLTNKLGRGQICELTNQVKYPNRYCNFVRSVKKPIRVFLNVVGHLVKEPNGIFYKLTRL